VSPLRHLEPAGLAVPHDQCGVDQAGSEETVDSDTGVAMAAIPPKPKEPSVVGRIAALLLAVAVTVLIFFYRDRLADFSSYGYLGLFVVSIVGNATILLPAPSLAATFLAGGIFNPVLAGVVSGAGMAIGELSGYMAGYGGTAILDPRDLERFEKLQNWMRRHGFLTIFVLAVVPNPIFDLAGVAAGVLHFPLPRFLLACFLGKTVKGLAFALAGAQSLQSIEQFLR
jgi:membrane protein YqaA with SNARE-associated domain